LSQKPIKEKLNKCQNKKLFLPLIALAILCSCEKSSEVDVIAEEGLIGVSLRLDKGFSISSSDSSADSSWSHIFQESVDITFSSSTTSYSKTVSFNPNDVSSFPNTSLPFETLNTVPCRIPSGNSI